MMKKMLALIMALLLPVAALADASRLTVTMTVDEENAAAMYQSAGVFDGARNEEALCAALARMLNGTAMSILMQDDALSLDLSLANTELFDLDVLWGGDSLIITSEMMDGYGLSVPMSELDASNDEFLLLLQQTDWEEMLRGIMSAVMDVVSAPEVSTVRGSFNGDAFTGGVYCETVIVDDAWVAAVLDAALTEEVRAFIEAACDYWAIDHEELLEGYEAMNAQAAQNNAHRYILRVVYNGQMIPVGMSITVMRGSSQLATFSMGVETNEIRVVVGLPLAEENYWHSCTCTFAEPVVEDGVEVREVQYSVVEFTAPKDESFSYASATSNAITLACEWAVETRAQGNATAWQLEMVRRAGAEAPLESIEGSALYIEDARFNGTLSFALNGEEYMELHANWAPCEMIDSDGEGLTLIDLVEGDSATLDTVAMSFGMELVQRLLRVIPAELMQYTP